MSPDPVGYCDEQRAAMAQGYQVLMEGDATQALQFFQQALAAACTDEDRADAMSMVGRCYGTVGDFESAELALTEALRIAANLPHTLARVKLQMGTVRWQQGQLDSAKQFLSQAAVELRRLGGGQTIRLRALGNLGLVLYTRGEYHEAILAYKAALELAQSLNDWSSIVLQSNNLGECYQDLGDLGKARELHERALAIARDIGLGMGGYIDALRNLGVDLLHAGELDQAFAKINESMVLARECHRKDLELQCIVSLAQVHYARQAYDQAEAAARQLIQESPCVPVRLAAARWVLGLCRLACNDPQQAISLLEAGLIDAQVSYSKIWILRLHAALSQIVSHTVIAQVHRRIAAELVQQIADSLDERALRTVFLQSPLARSVL